MHKNSEKQPVYVATAILAALLTWLGANCSSTLLPGQNNGTPAAGAATVKVAADFTKDGSARTKNNAAKLPCPSVATGQDDPILQAGLDCDGNGGVVQFITPTSFKVAVRHLVFIDADGNAIDIIPAATTLAESEVLDLSQAVTLPAPSIPAGVYPTFRADIYYFELQMPLYDPNALETIRVYMSDDDFPAEGSLGHHQGDITMIAADGTEIGFVDVGMLWQAASLQPTRGITNGAGAVDPETGHLRGLYGDQQLWDDPDQNQGANQDIFVMSEPLNLTIDDTPKTVTITFDVKDTWFYEDFDNDQLFNPCENGNQDGCGGAWSPVFNPPETLIEMPPAMATSP